VINNDFRGSIRMFHGPNVPLALAFFFYFQCCRLMDSLNRHRYLDMRGTPPERLFQQHGDPDEHGDRNHPNQRPQTTRTL